MTKKELIDLCNKQSAEIQRLEAELEKEEKHGLLEPAKPSYEELNRQCKNFAEGYAKQRQTLDAFIESLRLLNQELEEKSRMCEMLESNLYDTNERANRLYDELTKLERKNNE